jgi:hypothetical protein
MTSKQGMLLVAIAAVTGIATSYIGWFAVAVVVGVLGGVFGLYLWRLAGISRRVCLYLIAQVLLVWIAFGLAYYELVPDLRSAAVAGFQGLFHMDAIPVAPALTESTAFALLAGFESLVGYLLIVSGVALSVRTGLKKSTSPAG